MNKHAPTIELVVQNNYTKILKVAGATDAEIKEHKIHIDGILLMKSGRILFRFDQEDHQLGEEDQLLIPADKFHWVKFLEAGTFYLILSKDTEFAFKK